MLEGLHGEPVTEVSKVSSVIIIIWGIYCIASMSHVFGSEMTCLFFQTVPWPRLSMSRRKNTTNICAQIRAPEVAARFTLAKFAVMIHYLPHRLVVHRCDYSPHTPSTHTHTRARQHAVCLLLLIIHVYISCPWFVRGWNCWTPARGPLTWNLLNDSQRAALLNVMTRRREISYPC